MIYTLFKDDFAKLGAADRQALAKRLLSEAAATRDDPVARYVLLIESTDLASLAGDPATTYKAAMQLARYYRVDEIELKKQALFRSNYTVTTAEGNEMIARLALETADEAAKADAFDSVTQLANLAEGAAEKTHKVAFVTSIQVRLGELRGLVNDYPNVQRALKHLQESPDDADAHLQVGKFYALRKGQWATGLPHLAAGNDETLRELAQQELANPTDGLKQAVLGDAWWGVGENASGGVRMNVLRHACEWYRMAKPNLAGITLTRIQARMESVAPPQTVEALVGATDSSAVDLLRLIDPAKDSTDGKWSLVGEGLQCAAASRATINIPYTLPDEYDLRITFARMEGQGPITILLTSHNKAFDFALDVKGEARFERVASKIGKDNPTTAPVAITNNRRYTLTLQVHQGSVRAFLDGKVVTEWKTDYKDLSRYAVWSLPNEKLPGLGANNAKVIFSAVDLIEINTKGRGRGDKREQRSSRAPYFATDRHRQTQTVLRIFPFVCACLCLAVALNWMEFAVAVAATRGGLS